MTELLLLVAALSLMICIPQTLLSQVHLQQYLCHSLYPPSTAGPVPPAFGIARGLLVCLLQSVLICLQGLPETSALGQPGCQACASHLHLLLLLERVEHLCCLTSLCLGVQGVSDV